MERDPSYSTRPAWDAAYEALFADLRRIAAKLLSRERPGHSLRPTVLVGDAYLKLCYSSLYVHDATHFFALNYLAMRQALTDHARRRNSRSQFQPTYVRQLLRRTASDDRETQFALRQVLAKLGAVDPLAADCVWLRYGEGMSVNECAARLQITPSRVKENAAFALHWLADHLR